MKWWVEQYFDRIGPMASPQRIGELCGDVTSWGRGDDEKGMNLCQTDSQSKTCSDEKHYCQRRLKTDLARYAASPHGPNCLVLSLGSNNQWSFERLATELTSCDIHTFDCTGSWSVPKSLKGRVMLHKLCMGLPKQVARRPDMFANYTGLLMRVGGRKPLFMKVDIEGFEYQLLRYLINGTNNGVAKTSLPAQLAIEMHRGITAPKFNYWIPGDVEFSQLMALMRSRYEVVHQRDNGAKARELLLVEVGWFYSSWQK